MQRETQRERNTVASRKAGGQTEREIDREKNGRRRGNVISRSVRNATMKVRKKESDNHRRNNSFT